MTESAFKLNCNLILIIPNHDNRLSGDTKELVHVRVVLRISPRTWIHQIEIRSSQVVQELKQVKEQLTERLASSQIGIVRICRFLMHISSVRVVFSANFSQCFLMIQINVSKYMCITLYIILIYS